MRLRARRIFCALSSLLLLVLFSIAEGGIAKAAAAQTSWNWAGYIAERTATQLPIKYGTARWIVPDVLCGRNENSKASVWLGLGHGTTNDVLFQTGTTSSCVNGV